MDIRTMFKSKGEKQYLQELQSQIKGLRRRFPENTPPPSSGPSAYKISELKQEVNLLQNALDQIEASRVSTVPRIPTVPNHIIELDASQTVAAGTLPLEPTIRVNASQTAAAGTLPLEPTIHVNANLYSTQNHTTGFSHLDIDLGILGLKTLHLYIVGGFVLAYKLSDIAIKTIEIISIVLRDSAVVRGLTFLGLGVIIAVVAAVTHVNHSNNARRVAEKGIMVQAQAQEQRQRQLEMEKWSMARAAKDDTRERVLTLENSNPGVAFPRLQTAVQRENVRVR